MTNINNEIKELIDQRLAKGQKTYGHGVQLEDSRDFTQEALEEVLDTAVYTAAKLLQLKHKKENPSLKDIIDSLTLGTVLRIYYSTKKYDDYVLAICKYTFDNSINYGLLNVGGNKYSTGVPHFSSCRSTFELFKKDFLIQAEAGKYKLELIDHSKIAR